MERKRIYLQAPNPGTKQNFFSIRQKSEKLDRHFQTTLHWHDYYELELITGGLGVHTLNGRAYPLSRGAVYLLSPKDFHTVTEDENAPLTLYNVNFSERLLSHALQERLAKHNLPLTLSLDEADTAALEQLASALSEECDAPNDCHAEMIAALFSQFLIRILRHAPHCPAARTDTEQKAHAVSRVIAYLKIHFREPITLAECAKTVYLTPNYLGELFRDTTGQTYRQYLQDLRFEYAVDLLASSSASIEEIARVSGFSSPSYFTALFRKHFDKTPTEYRQGLSLAKNKTL